MAWAMSDIIPYGSEYEIFYMIILYVFPIYFDSCGVVNILYFVLLIYELMGS